MPGSPGFKHCLTCRSSIPVSDGHSQCVRCLGETHIPQKCSHCHNLKACTRKARDLQLKLLIMEKSLHLASDPGLQTPPRSPTVVSDRGFPPSSERKEHSSKERTKKQVLTSPSQETTKMRHSLTCQTPLVPTTLRPSTSEVAGPSGTVGTT